MASTSDRSEINESFGKNLTNINADDDFMKSIKNEIMDVLELDGDDDEMGDRVVKDLLKNGRTALTEHQDDIISKVYNEVMIGNATRLMSSLKKYFRQKWEVQYGSSNSWFISFLKEYENGENHDIYEKVLIRTAQYGDKYMKDCPLLSIVLQLLFESIDDDCLQETNSVFDALWTTITNDGLHAITKYSDYTVGKVLNEQLKKQSVLFEALRDYYRSSVFSALTQSTIVNKQNFYDLALDDVVEHGWLSDMKSIQDEIAPRRYRMLLDNLRSFYKKQKSEENVNPNGVALPKCNANDGEQLSKTEESGNESDETHDSKNTFSSTDNEVCSKNAIFISGLPKNMQETSLFDKLNEVFNTCGDIQIYEKTNEPDIWLSPQRRNGFELDGTAIISFEKEESAMTAIQKYNKTQVPALDDKQITVRLYQIKPMGVKTLPGSTAADHSKNVHRTIDLTDLQRSKGDRSASSHSSLNSASVHRATGTINTETFSKDAIFIKGLPTNMSEENLLDALQCVFSKAGQIKINKRTNKPCILLYRVKGCWNQLSGMGEITFENEESAKRAITNYNDRKIALLNDRQIFIQRKRIFSPKAVQPPEHQLQTRYSRPEGQPDGPVCIFWDIENVAIPAGNNAFDIILELQKQMTEDRKLVKGLFKTYYRNINTIPQQHRAALNHAGVTVQHIESYKTAGVMDMQIHHDLQQFIEEHRTPATVVLISGDIDFIQALNALRFRHRHYTIVIHNDQVKVELLKTANEFISWKTFFNKKCFNKPQQNVAPNIPKLRLKKLMQSQVPSIGKPVDKLKITASSNQNLHKTGTPTPSSQYESLIDLSVDDSTVNNNENVLESILTVEDRPQTQKLAASKAKKKLHAQHPTPLMLLANDSSNSIAANDNLAVSSTDESTQCKKINDPAKIVHRIPCPMCEKTFSSKGSFLQHKQDKHRIGALVDFSTSPPTADSNNCSQLSSYSKQKSVDLIVFTDDNDCNSPQSNIPLTIIETSSLAPINDDDSSTFGFDSELNDNVQLQINSSDVEKSTEIDVAEHIKSDPEKSTETDVAEHIELDAEKSTEIDVAEHIKSDPEKSTETDVAEHIKLAAEKSTEIDDAEHIKSDPEKSTETDVAEHIKSDPEKSTETDVAEHIKLAAEKSTEIDDADHIQ